VAAVDDRVMLTIVRVLLDYPGEYTLQPKTLAELLSRLYELMTYETAKRPNHRPRLDDGASVATLIECGATLDKAIRLQTMIAKKTNPKKTEAAVTKAYERYRKQKRQK